MAKNGRCSSRSAFGQSTGNDISGHCKGHYFPDFSRVFFTLPITFLIEVLGSQTTYLAKVNGSPRVDTFPDPVSHFGGPLAAILDFACGAVLRVVSECTLYVPCTERAQT